jgi:hypothetical protein
MITCDEYWNIHAGFPEFSAVQSGEDVQADNSGPGLPMWDAVVEESIAHAQLPSHQSHLISGTC